MYHLSVFTVILGSPDDHQAVPLMTSSRKSVVLSHPSSLEDYGPELNVSGSAHSYVVGSLSDSSLCVTPLSSESHWSLKVCRACIHLRPTETFKHQRD